MNKKVISKILFAVFAVALCAAAYFAADIRRQNRDHGER